MPIHAIVTFLRNNQIPIIAFACVWWPLTTGQRLFAKTDGESLVSADVTAGLHPHLSFVVLGHIRGDSDGEANPLLDELIEKVRALKPDLVFLTGDMIWGFADEPMADPAVVIQDWERLDAKLESLGIPIYRVPGNHDINDPVTRDTYFGRYGPLPQAVSHQRCRFILLNSTYVPRGMGPTAKYVLTAKLDREQLAFLSTELNDSDQYDHVFLFMHHLLWWQEEAAWWKDVHPMLIANKVHAVFSGDLGPMMFTHMNKDGVHYIRSTLSTPVVMATGIADRQFDNFVHVNVRGPHVDFNVMTVGAISSGRFAPTHWTSIHGQDRVDDFWVYDPDRDNLFRRVWKEIGTPRRLLAVTVGLATSFFSGLAVAWIFQRRAGANRDALVKQ
jgi:3',5'-cyclic AMP phosphodiesterase CpdA